MTTLSLDHNTTHIMGVLNVTPDSFSDGGKFFDVDHAVTHAKQLVVDGAGSIDIGGVSSRPGSQQVSIEEELRRVLPVVERLSQEVSVPISIDTYSPEVAKQCLQRGATFVNDITGLRNHEMVEIVAAYKVPVCIMHMQGMPQNMQNNPTYTDVVHDIIAFFEDRIAAAKQGGIKDEQIILDPGIGFGKTVEHNLQILKRLNEMTALGYPVLVGTSRKSFIGVISDLPVGQRLEGTIASSVVGIMNGARMIRVHDVKACKRAVEIVDAIRNTSTV